MDFTHKRNIIRFFQDEQPQNPDVGDLWFQPFTQNTYRYINSLGSLKWYKLTNKTTYGPGSDYGFHTGGYCSTTSTYMSQVYRIRFPFDAGEASYISNLAQTSGGTCGFNSVDYGYACGGYTGSELLSSVQRLQFPFDSGSVVNVVGLMGDDPDNAAGFNSSVYGYICGGLSSHDMSTNIQRIAFPFDSGTGSKVGVLSGSPVFEGGSANCSTHGYIICGRDNRDDGVAMSTIDRIAFPFDSGTATHVGNNAAAAEAPGTCNSSTNVYMSYATNIATIIFPFDSGTATVAGAIEVNLREACNSSRHGFFMAGATADICRLTFPFDSGTASKVGTTPSQFYSASCCDGTDFVSQFI